MSRLPCGLFNVVLRASLLSGTAMLPPARASAQAPTVVSGTVTDSTGAGISGAIVTLSSGTARAVTDDSGEFRLTGVPGGPVDLRVRRLGYVAVVQPLRATPPNAATGVHVILAPLPSTLNPVLVQAKRIEYRGRLAGYYQRLERRSSGVFIDRTEIDKKAYRSLTQLLSQSPGITAGRIRAGGGAVRMRGRNCRPLVWIDGVPMPAGEVDLDAFPLSTLQGIEMYLGGTTAPTDFTAPNGESSCGTILLWSRGKDTELAALPRRATEDLEDLAASLAVYTQDQVDRPARLRAQDSLQVPYPAPLFASGVEGAVMAEFVVDGDGAIEPGTFNIVSYTHPLFAQAVNRALERATYVPAMKDGRQVRQLVHQPFSFVRRSGKAAASAKD